MRNNDLSVYLHLLRNIRHPALRWLFSQEVNVKSEIVMSVL